MPEVTIWSQANLSTQAERIGGTRGSNVTPEAVSYTWDQHGPSKASFTLRRDPNVPWPDLGALTPIDIDVNGTRVWAGRISESPRQTGDTNVINVQCEGWQAHLEDDLTTKLYVHTNLADWVDAKSMPGAHLGAGFVAAVGSVANGTGLLTLTWPANTAITSNALCEVGLDFGAGMAAKRVLAFFALSNTTASAAQRVYGSNTKPEAQAAFDASDLTTLGTVANNAGTPNAIRGTFTTAQRYVMLVNQWIGLGATTTVDVFSQLTSVLIFGSAAWESGDASILKASDVVKDLLPLATLLNQTDLSQITASTFSIPELYVSNPSTPGEIMRSVNSYHDWLLQVDHYRRMVFKAKPTVPVVSIGAWSNAQIQDTAAGTSTDVYNKAILAASAPDGTNLLVTRTAAAPLLTAAGITRTKSIQVSGPSTVSALNQLGDTFLSSHTVQPFKGSVIGMGVASFRSSTGGQFPSYLIPTLAGQLIRLDHWIDPDTGGRARDGRIAEATYTVDDDTVNVSLDNTRANFEAFLGRLQILTQSVVGS